MDVTDKLLLYVFILDVASKLDLKVTMFVFYAIVFYSIIKVIYAVRSISKREEVLYGSGGRSS